MSKSIPDEKVFPTATGRAAQTVDQHQAKQHLTFYGAWFCPFVQRAWISLEEKGIPYQYKEINPYKKEPHFLEINPKGLVPAVEWQGKPLYESLVILEFLEDAFPSHKPHLLPADPYTRGHVRLWTDFVSKSIVPAFHRLVQAQDADRQKTALEEWNKALRELADKVKGPYFLGDALSFVDVAIAPWVVRDYILAEHRGYKREAVGDKWKVYAEALETRPSVINTQSDKEHYEEIYGRYLRDEAQSEVAKATRAGRVLP